MSERFGYISENHLFLFRGDLRAHAGGTIFRTTFCRIAIYAVEITLY